MSTILTNAQLQAHLEDTRSLTDLAPLDRLAKAADAFLAGLTGRPPVTPGGAATLTTVTYVHRTHQRPALLVAGDGNPASLQLPVGPVRGTVTVTEDGAVLDASAYELDPLGHTLYRLDWPSSSWSMAPRGIAVSYPAGFGDGVAGDVETGAPMVFQALLATAAWLWSRQSTAGVKAASYQGYSATFDVKQIPAEVREAALEAGLFLPRAVRRLRALGWLTNPQPAAAPAAPVLDLSGVR